MSLASEHRSPAGASSSADGHSARVLAAWITVIGGIVAVSALRSLQAVQILALAVVVFLAAGLPLMVGVRRPLHHPSVVALALIAAFNLPKAYWIAVNGVQSPEVQVGLLRGHADVALIWGLLALAAGYLAYSLGVMSTKRPFRSPRWFLFRRPSQPNWGRLVPILIASAALCAVAMVIFIASTGFDFTPRKRFGSLGASRIFILSYIWFRIALLSRPAVICALFWRAIAMSEGRAKTSRVLGYVAATNALVAMTTAYLASNRAGVLLVLLDIVLVRGALEQRRRRWIPVLGIGAVSLAVTASLLSARQGRSLDGEVLESFVLSRDLADFSKVGVIIESGYSTSGNSLWHWMVGPLPPSIWPFENEWVDFGKDVWRSAYGVAGSGNGVPPSFAGELAAAFGWLGVPIGMFFFGVIVKKLYVLTQNLVHLRAPGAMVALVILVRMNIFVLSSDLGTGITTALVEATPLALILAFGEQRRRSRGRAKTPVLKGPSSIDAAAPGGPSG